VTWTTARTPAWFATVSWGGSGSQNPASHLLSFKASRVADIAQLHSAPRTCHPGRRPCSRRLALSNEKEATARISLDCVIGPERCGLKHLKSGPGAAPMRIVHGRSTQRPKWEVGHPRQFTAETRNRVRLTLNRILCGGRYSRHALSSPPPQSRLRSKSPSRRGPFPGPSRSARGRGQPCSPGKMRGSL
jgi:hypothetical protein